MPAPTDPTSPTGLAGDLAVTGTVPAGLSGHLIGVEPGGVAHSFRFDRGRISYGTRPIGARPRVDDLVAFEGSLLVFGDDSSLHELGTDLGQLRRVDLAGHGRTVAACPVYDAETGELHLVAHDWGGTQMHVVVPAGALTRRSRAIADAPARIEGLAIGRDHVVFVAVGVVGIASRDGDGRTTWVATGAAAPTPVHTYWYGDTVVLVGLTPSLERWHLPVAGGTVRREVLDPAPHAFAHTGGGAVDAADPDSDRNRNPDPNRNRNPDPDRNRNRNVWTAGQEMLSRHDVIGTGNRSLSLAPHTPSDFAVAPDAAHPDSPDAGWVLAFVHDPSAGASELRVIDAAGDQLAAIATIRIPRRAPRRLRCAWLASPLH